MSADPQTTAPPRRHNTIVIAAYAALAVVMTWPLLPEIHRAAIGIAGGDVWDHLWTMDHARRAVTEPGVSLLQHPQAYHPEGLVLFPLNVLNEVISVPLQMVVGLKVAYNLMMLLQLVFGGWAGYRLALHLLKSPPAAWMTGALFAFNPCTLSALVNGVPEAANSGWIPLYIWLLMRSSRDPGVLRSTLPPAFALFFSAVASWYVGAFNLIFTALYYAYTLTLQRDPDWPRLRWRIPAAAMLGGLLIVPVALVFRYTLEHTDAADFREASDFIGRALQDPTYSANLIAFVLPRMGWSTAGFLHSPFIGFTVTILALLGVAASGNDRRSRGLWALTAVVFAGFALGPVLWIDGHPETKLPYYYLMKHAPLFHGLEFPYRFAIVAALAMAVLAGYGVRGLTERMSRGQRLLLVFIVSALVMTEYGIDVRWPLPRVSTRLPDHLYALRAERGDGAVIEFPFGYDFKGRHFYHQLAHRHPVVVGINSLCPHALIDALDVGPKMPRRIELTQLTGQQLAALRRMEIRYLVWNDWDAPDHQALLAHLKAQRFRIVESTEQGVVFDLGGDGIPADALPGMRSEPQMLGNNRE